MKNILYAFIVLVSITACGQSSNKNFRFPAAENKKPANEAVATFAEGCFWHTELVFQSLVGVRDAVSGYTGGKTKNPDYDEVSGGETGHAEAVQVFYDPSLISYETLVKAFFASQDPTTPNRQGNDVGPQYRSIAFYKNDKEKAVIEAEIKRLTDAKAYRSKIVTEVMPLTKFYNAEDYHQEYIARHADNPYVSNVSIPDYLSFRRSFKGNFKL